MSKLELKGCIENNTIKYKDPDFRKKIEIFKSKNECKDIEIVFLPAFSAEFHQHKFYRGYILNSISHFWGEKNDEMVHFKLKKMFLRKKITPDCLDEIPRHHYGGKTIFMTEPLDDCDMETGEIIKVDKITGYIPSTGCLTYEEFKEFIEKCEEFLIIELNGHIIGNQQEIAREKIKMLGDRIK